MNLTAKQIKFFDELTADREASARTLKVAMAFHSNFGNELIKREQDIWKRKKEANEENGF